MMTAARPAKYTHPKGQHQRLSALLSINPGAGGRRSFVHKGVTRKSWGTSVRRSAGFPAYSIAAASIHTHNLSLPELNAHTQYAKRKRCCTGRRIIPLASIPAVAIRSRQAKAQGAPPRPEPGQGLAIQHRHHTTSTGYKSSALPARGCGIHQLGEYPEGPQYGTESALSFKRQESRAWSSERNANKVTGDIKSMILTALSNVEASYSEERANDPKTAAAFLGWWVKCCR